MEDYVTITIFGGYHNGQEYNLLKDVTYVQLQEDVRIHDYTTSGFYTNKPIKVHTYRKLDVRYVKDFKRSPMTNSWKQLEDLNIFIPEETSTEYEETLKKIIGKALNANWIRKYEEI